MTSLSHKIDFAVILRVKNANPNGDPLNGNRPRTDYSGFGEITDVCLKRKIRDRLLERWLELDESSRAGQAIFVQSDDRKADDFTCLRDRAKSVLNEKASTDETTSLACRTWFDVRAFGQLFAYSGKSGKKGKDGDGNDSQSGVSIAIRGPVTLHSAFSISPVSITSTQITKSVSGEGDGSKRGSDTMGMKHRVDQGVYVFYGSMNPQLSEKTGFDDADAEVIKSILPRLFENDASSARPEGSMEVQTVFWWRHSSRAGQYSSAKVHGSLSVQADGTYVLAPIAGLEPEVIAGF
jgi:CRISPR-associated protein Csd2